MNLTLNTLLLLFISIFAQAQGDYFQQEVNYKIEVTLNDQDHTLAGKIVIEYTNNSTQPLESIFMHLWPNAYSNRQTAFAKQQVRNKHGKFYFAKEKDMGNISGLDFKTKNQSLELSIPNPDNPDIAILKFNELLKTGETITFSSPFKVKIPASFSRMGHVQTSYQITQWYPKPAVFDRYGWHPMPYLSNGEFYSEFGHFDVTITLPKNYVVGATGTLQTKSEIEFLNQKVADTKKITEFSLDDSFPPSDTETKTIRYTADRVHDFAWFADKRFNVLKSEVELNSGKTVTTWAMFPNFGGEDWIKATDYIDRSVKHYSDLVGEYPYPQATAVMSALSAGAGMEYPMITVIGEEQGKNLDDVITHEVGHNWFYGILANNERDFPWMDEGLNTYYEQRYMNKYYKSSVLNEQKMLYLIKARMHQDVSPNYPVTKMSEMNYGLSAYAKPSISLKMLEDYVGTKQFDKIMQKYYETWKFKHPNPNDFKDIWTSNTNKDLEWFFNGIINTTDQMDYKLIKAKEVGAKTEVIIKNKGKLAAPFYLYAFNNNEAVDSMVIDGFIGEKSITFPEHYEEIVIDPDGRTLDVNDRNNSNIMARPKIGIGLKRNKEYTFILPAYAWNKYDKSMLGIQIVNQGILTQKLYYEFAPLYSFDAKTIVGQGLIEYPIYTKGFLHHITPGLSFRRFSNFHNKKHNYHETYNRIVPSITFELRKRSINTRRKFVLRHEIIQTDIPNFDNSGNFKNKDKQLNQYAQLAYASISKNAYRMIDFRVGLEYSNYTYANISNSKKYLKALIHSHNEFFFQEKKRFTIGINGGYFLQNDARYSSSFNNGLVMGSLSASGTGKDDYAFRSLYLGRSEQEGFLSNQVYTHLSMLKTPVLNSPIGHSNDWMLGIKLMSDLPLQLPVFLNFKPYFDAVFYGVPNNKESTKLAKMYSGGVQLDLKILKINFPIFQDKDLNLLLKGRGKGNYFSRVTYEIDLGFTSPKKIQTTALNLLL